MSGEPAPQQARSQQARWGIVSTVKAPASDLLKFCAYHLEAGAHRIFIYLDTPCPQARPYLKAHPKIRVFDCTDASWQQRRSKGKPGKHQSRQTLNATRAYRRQCQDLDWIAHVDVDEFIWSETPISEVLAGLPDSIDCARMRPIESLSGSTSHFKGFIPSGPKRATTVGRIYPLYGEHIAGGFLSHLQGKLFVRTGLDQFEIRIHNAYQDKVENPNSQELPQIDLCHLHVGNWDSWLAQYRYRLNNGSYRSELSPARPRHRGGITKHELLIAIEKEQGIDGLRKFYDEICADSPMLRDRLSQEGLLRHRDLQLTACLEKHFPDFANIEHRPSSQKTSGGADN